MGVPRIKAVKMTKRCSVVVKEEMKFSSRCSLTKELQKAYHLVPPFETFLHLHMQIIMAISAYRRGNANEMIYFNDPQAEVVVNDCPGNGGYHEKMVLILIHSVSTVRTYRDWKHSSDTRGQRREHGRVKSSGVTG